VKLDRLQILEKSHEIAERHNFIDSVDTPQDGMTLCSEVQMFCAMCDLYDIDLVVESGLYHGISTKMISDYFNTKKRADSGKLKKIISIDIRIKPTTEEKFRHTNNVKILSGNSMEIMLKTIKQEKRRGARKVAAYIDGPKGHLQSKLAREIVDHVEFVGMHDVGEQWSNALVKNGLMDDCHINIKNYTTGYFLSSDPWYSDHFSHLNVEQLSWLKGGSDHRWNDNRDDGFDQELFAPIIESISPQGFGLGIISRYGVNI
tara:strand:+ start:95 stop:874 length:780 start_codon:yes stop_codon:yes gene_type:complete